MCACVCVCVHAGLGGVISHTPLKCTHVASQHVHTTLPLNTCTHVTSQHVHTRYLSTRAHTLPLNTCTHVASQHVHTRCLSTRAHTLPLNTCTHVASQHVHTLPQEDWIAARHMHAQSHMPNMPVVLYIVHDIWLPVATRQINTTLLQLLLGRAFQPSTNNHFPNGAPCLTCGGAPCPRSCGATCPPSGAPCPRSCGATCPLWCYLNSLWCSVSSHGATLTPCGGYLHSHGASLTPCGGYLHSHGATLTPCGGYLHSHGATCSHK